MILGVGAASAFVSTPMIAAAGEGKTVTDRIAEFLSTKQAFDETILEDDDAAFDLPVWPAFQDAERALISHPCANEDDRRRKIAFALSDPYFFDTISTNTEDGVPVIKSFLRSLV